MKELGGLFPSDAESSEVLYPTDGAFDDPSPTVSAQGTAVLGNVLGTPVGAVRDNHLNVVHCHFLDQLVTVIGLVANDALGHLFVQHEVQQVLHQGGLTGAGRNGVHRQGQTPRIRKHHDLHTFSPIVQPMPSAPRRALLKLPSTKHS